jgi:hypothetical protein
LAVRLSAGEPIDAATVAAMVTGPDGAISGKTIWREVTNSGGKDGWVVFTSTDTLPLGCIVTIDVTAKTLAGDSLATVSKQFTTSTSKADETTSNTPQIYPDSTVGALPNELAAAASKVYRVGPAGVFDQPVTIQIPVPAGDKAADLDVYYFSESQLHTGWYLAGNVSGWMVSGSRRTIKSGGATYIEIQINHSGVVQLGRALHIKTAGLGDVAVRLTGSKSSWGSLCIILFGLSMLLGRITKERKKHSTE